MPIISLLQDPYEINSPLFNQQIEVCNLSSHVVFNSEYTKERYENFLNVPTSVIEIGTNHNLFFPLKEKKINQKQKMIGYIGSTNEEFKGYSMVKEIIERTNYNFILILKDNGHFENERVRVYNKIPQEEIAILLNEIDIVICTSKHETLH